MGGTHIDVTTLGRNAHLFLKNAGPPMQNLEAFREVAELNLKVSFRIMTKSVIGVSNSCDLARLELKKKAF